MVEWQAKGWTTQGASHLRSGLRNQDSFRVWTPDGRPAMDALVAVSDGHGSARHFRSDVGSQFAVEVVELVFNEVRERPAFANDADRWKIEVAERIVAKWRNQVESHIRKYPFKESELATVRGEEGALEAVEADPVLAYGATVLAVMVTKSCLAYFQLGDGDILRVDSEGHAMPVLPEDSRLIANRTTSLCQPDAGRQFRFHIENVEQPPALVLVSTDGYSNSFKTYEDFKLIGPDYLRMLRERGIEAMSEDLPAILSDASASGSGDDITLGMLIRVTPQLTGQPIASIGSKALDQLALDLRTQQLKLEQLQHRFEALARYITRASIAVGLLILCAALGTGGLLLKRHWYPRIHPATKPAANDASTGSPGVTQPEGDQTSDQEAPQTTNPRSARTPRRRPSGDQGGVKK